MMITSYRLRESLKPPRSRRRSLPHPSPNVTRSIDLKQVIDRPLPHAHAYRHRRNMANPLIAGTCVLRYDPVRIVKEMNLNPASEIRAHVRFHPSGGLWEGQLRLPPNAHLKDMADPAGQGVMLETTFDLPADCDELEVWFCAQAPGGGSCWDSNHGKNFWLRFALHDLQVSRAEVRPVAGQPQDAFELEVGSVLAVEAITVRWRLPSVPGEPRRETVLRQRADRLKNQKTWTPTAAMLVPHAAAVVFDLVYSVRARKFTDDNQGRWYLAD